MKVDNELILTVNKRIKLNCRRDAKRFQNVHCYCNKLTIKIRKTVPLKSEMKLILCSEPNNQNDYSMLMLRECKVRQTTKSIGVASHLKIDNFESRRKHLGRYPFRTRSSIAKHRILTAQTHSGFFERITQVSKNKEFLFNEIKVIPVQLVKLIFIEKAVVEKVGSIPSLNSLYAQLYCIVYCFAQNPR